MTDYAQRVAANQAEDRRSLLRRLDALSEGLESRNLRLDARTVRDAADELRNFYALNFPSDS